MKIIANLFLVLILMSSCEKKQAIKQITASEEKVRICAHIDNWHKSAAEANFESYFEGMAEEGVFIGTDASENWTISEFKAFSKPHFDKGNAWDFTSIERNVYLNSTNDFAWFDELLDTWMGVCRGSGVLKKTDDIWKIEHYVLSLTIRNNCIDDVLKITKKKDSIFLRNMKN